MHLPRRRDTGPQRSLSRTPGAIPPQPGWPGRYGARPSPRRATATRGFRAQAHGRPRRATASTGSRARANRRPRPATATRGSRAGRTAARGAQRRPRVAAHPGERPPAARNGDPGATSPPSNPFRPPTVTPDSLTRPNRPVTATPNSPLPPSRPPRYRPILPVRFPTKRGESRLRLHIGPSCGQLGLAISGRTNVGAPLPARQPAPATQPANGALRRRRDWRADGACRDEDPEVFFPITSQGLSIRDPGRRTCAPAVRYCLNAFAARWKIRTVMASGAVRPKKSARGCAVPAPGRTVVTQVTAVAS